VLVDRPTPFRLLENAFRAHPIAALLGPRQCGKTTLARAFAEAATGPCTFFDLEDPVDLRRLSAPKTVLQELAGLVIIDEVQRQPELFPLLRVLVDRPEADARFLVLGSASPFLVKGVSETLAGRVGFVDLGGFSLDEVGVDQQSCLWTRGGFPRSFLAPDGATSFLWRDSFIRTFLERDIPQLGITTPADTLRRFWTMIAHYHGQIWNAADFGRSLGFSANTARSYLDILSGAFMVRVLTPWFENLKKRQVKAPKIYLRDSGLLHALLSLESRHDVLGHPKLGASWEGFAMEQILTGLGARDVYFWATHSGAELDLLVTIGGRRHGFELKYSDAPGRSRSMGIAIRDLNLHHLWVVYPGAERYSLDKQLTVLPLHQVKAAVTRGPQES
jgi:predicted AAA+ superfamily ATPase